jgi:hypothetical protein
MPAVLPSINALPLTVKLGLVNWTDPIVVKLESLLLVVFGPAKTRLELLDSVAVQLLLTDHFWPLAPVPPFQVIVAA